MPEVEYSLELKERMEDLKSGWLKCKNYIGSNLKNSSDDGKVCNPRHIHYHAVTQL